MMVKLFGTLEIGGTGQQVAVVDESGRNVSNSVNNPASQRRNRCVENVQRRNRQADLLRSQESRGSKRYIRPDGVGVFCERVRCGAGESGASLCVALRLTNTLDLLMLIIIQKLHLPPNSVSQVQLEQWIR